MPITETQKNAIKKWRENHKEQFYAYKKKADKIYYETHKKEIGDRQNKKYRISREFLRLSNMFNINII